MEEDPLITAHRRSSRHRAEVAVSVECGCFYCLAIFGPAEINVWIDAGETALCPRCGVDAVLGSGTAGSVSRPFLESMRKKWFMW